MADRSTHLARKLRRDQTYCESIIWRALRDRRLDGRKFRRQVPLGPYIVDFVCFRTGLVIEIDGGQHEGRAGYDRERDAWLRSRGFRVIRFWNHDVVERRIDVLEEILRRVEQ